MLSRDDLHALLPRLDEFHGRFGRFFARSESRAWSRKYLVGLALPIERKNVENIGEQVGGSPRRRQEFLSDSPWNDEGCIEELQRLVGEELGMDDGVLILDDTGFPKKGIWSARQERPSRWSIRRRPGMPSQQSSPGCDVPPTDYETLR